MKKILSLLGALGLITSVTSTTIACNGSVSNAENKENGYKLSNALYDIEGNIKLTKKQVHKLFMVHFPILTIEWTKLESWTVNKNTLNIEMWNDKNGSSSKTEVFQYTVTEKDMDHLHWVEEIRKEWWEA